MKTRLGIFIVALLLLPLARAFSERQRLLRFFGRHTA